LEIEMTPVEIVVLAVILIAFPFAIYATRDKSLDNVPPTPVEITARVEQELQALD
jgi:hypothetical protein